MVELYDLDLHTMFTELDCHIVYTHIMMRTVKHIESRDRVVTRWPGNHKVSIPAATKIVRCKNLAFNIGECVSRG